ncbi:MAG: hypothetical protein R3C28_33260 [Pirellulaceae bacterium]
MYGPLLVIVGLSVLANRERLPMPVSSTEVMLQARISEEVDFLDADITFGDNEFADLKWIRSESGFQTQVLVPQGPHMVEIDADGYYTQKTTVDVSSQPQTIEFAAKTQTDCNRDCTIQ